MAADGLTAEEVQARQGDSVAQRSTPKALTAGTIFWTIFGALWAFTLSAAILYLMLAPLIKVLFS
ncbi:MAG: hypothetical protein ACLQG3_14580 [Terracidiphilus sp.]